jgi:hypothetical protein
MLEGQRGATFAAERGAPSGGRPGASALCGLAFGRLGRAVENGFPGREYVLRLRRFP